ncbi:MAG TPA: putative Na+/H+ antiporter [Chthoniobacterales bacterium]|jgi:Na+/H+ antiporter NhaD/arsenite permease-like protein
MSRYTSLWTLALLALLVNSSWAASTGAGDAAGFPLPLDAYGDNPQDDLWNILRNRVSTDPFNLIASVIFLLAIIHTFLASKFTHLSHKMRDAHKATVSSGDTSELPGAKERVCFKAEAMHFLGEVEAIFGIWVIPLLIAFTVFKGWPAAEAYVSHRVIFTEPMFVVIIMCIAATRPVLRFAEQCLGVLAHLGKGQPKAWWLSILTVGPLLGSFITEPAAMTICALLLARQFYDYSPSVKFRYATLGLLFVNISVGGTITHFAAPPVLMVAGKWGWDTVFMFTHFGWKAIIGIVAANLTYFAIFKKEFANLQLSADAESQPEQWSDRTDRVPLWVTVVHLVFLGWTVFTAHYPALFIGGFLFFLAFTAATEHHQNPLSLKPALLVGFFLAGLVVHGGLQGWWIEPVLSRLGETQLLLGAIGLTAFNDNAAITYLATLVPSFTDNLKYAVVAGAVVGGGLTVIANAPNPAGQSILSSYFKDGVAPLSLLMGALLPTAIMALIFLFL